MTDGVNGKVCDASVFALADDASAEIQIANPRTKTMTDMWITVLSRDSEKAKALARKQQNQRFRMMSRGRGGGGLALTAEELEEESLDMLVACTKSWRGVMWGTQELPCNAENARMLYTRSPIIREQVDDAIADRALFMRS